MYAGTANLELGFAVISVVCGWECIVIHGKYRWLLDMMTKKMRAGSSHMRCPYIVTFGQQKKSYDQSVQTFVCTVVST